MASDPLGRPFALFAIYEFYDSAHSGCLGVTDLLSNQGGIDAAWCCWGRLSLLK